MVLKFSSFTTPLGHSWDTNVNWENPLVSNFHRIYEGLHSNFSSHQTDTALNYHNNGNGTIFILGLIVDLQSLPSALSLFFFSQTYIFEAPVEDLQLLLGELSLLLQLVHALRAMTHSG